MLGLLIATIVTLIVAYLILTKVKAQAVLFVGGLFLMTCSVIFFDATILDAKKSTGLVWFDMIKYIENMFSSRAASLGLTIMAVGGFARYMDHINASKVLVKVLIRPLSLVRSPYIVLALSYVVGQILNIFIPSASGLGVLLMATIYPLLINLGVSKLSATAVIGTAACLDLGPASGNAILASKNGGMDVAVYFTEYQLPIAVVAMFTIAILHYFVQRWFDVKDGHVAEKVDITELEKDKNLPPVFYCLLPILPLGLILTFSQLFISTIKMSVISAMLISTALAMLFELIRTRKLAEVFGSIQVFFDGMAKQFAVVVTLIVAGETFAYGLTKVGAIEQLIDIAHYSGMGANGMTILMTGIIAIAAIVMGSGNAPFFAFAALAPEVADKMDVAPVMMLLPMQLAAGIARSVSPITAAIVAVCGISNVSPVDVVKRTAIPMAGALIVSVAMNFILF